MATVPGAVEIVISGWLLAPVLLLILFAFALWIATAWATQRVLLDVKRRRLLEIAGVPAEIEALDGGPADSDRFEALQREVVSRLDARVVRSGHVWRNWHTRRLRDMSATDASG